MVSRREFFAFASSSLILLPSSSSNRVERANVIPAKDIHGSTVIRGIMWHQDLKALMHLWQAMASKADKINVENVTTIKDG